VNGEPMPNENQEPDFHEPINVSEPAIGNDDLRKQLAQAEQQRDEYLLMVRQKQAEFENYQKRAARERDQERQYQYKPFALELLPVYDNLERTVMAAKQAGEEGTLVVGVQATMMQFLEALRRFGITRIAALDQPFDTNLHQALMQQPSAEKAPGTVLNVIQQGFMMHEQVLRPAHVIVAIAAG